MQQIWKKINRILTVRGLPNSGNEVTLVTTKPEGSLSAPAGIYVNLYGRERLHQLGRREEVSFRVLGYCTVLVSACDTAAHP